jgi:hypothetical protein
MACQENGPAAFDVEGETYREGQRVSVELTYHGGQKRRICGTLIVVTEDEAFIETDFGPMAGKVQTLVSEEA